MWTARVFTLYPEIFPGPLGSGLYKKALEKKLWSLEVINIRDYAVDKHKTVDDTPFGGGSGMLMRADVIANALDKNIPDKNEPIIYLSPKGNNPLKAIPKKDRKKNNSENAKASSEGAKAEPKKEEPNKEAAKAAEAKAEPKKEETKKHDPKA